MRRRFAAVFVGPLSMISHCRIVFVNQFTFDTFYSVTLAKCILLSVYMNINSARCMMHEKILNFINISEIFFNGLYLLTSRVNSAEAVHLLVQFFSFYRVGVYFRLR